MKAGVKHIVLALVVVSAAVFSRCANQVAPQGGPRDSLPPVVRAITPVGERNVKPSRVFITTDEYVQLKDLAKELYTSPPMKTKPSVVIRGRGVRIDIKDTLAENQTYSINFGNAIRDNNEGNPLSGFRYVFSTGPALDSLIMTGYAADAERGDSVSRAYVFFYDAKADSMPDYDSILLKHRPLAVGRTEGNGIFIAQNLKDMDYRAYALLDNNNNLKYDAGTDKVGFLDSVVNPAAMGEITMWLDEYRRYPTADPQTYFRMFAEPVKRRQNLTASERPGRHQAILRFAASHPRIDSLSFEGIDDDSVMREYMTAGRDTVSLWFNVPAASLPDTLKGSISYLKTDSLGNDVPTTQPLRLAWRYVETKEEQREREKQEKERTRAEERGEEYTEPEKSNPFRFKVDAGSKVNPEKGIPIEFDLPLASLDSARIRLLAAPAEGEGAGKGANAGAGGGEGKAASVSVEFSVARDTVNIRRWVISAPWEEGRSYSLTIPQGVFENIAGERNDSLGAGFTIDRRNEFASISLAVRGGEPETAYIVQLVDAKGKIIREITGVKDGGYTFHYIAETEVQLRVIRDGNGNGRWDSGSLVERRQPERTQFWLGASGDKVIRTPKGAEVDVDMDMAALFAPISIDRVMNELRRAEEARVSKYLEEKARKDAERRQAGTTEGAAGGFGIGSAMGSAREQIQSTVR